MCTVGLSLKCSNFMCIWTDNQDMPLARFSFVCMEKSESNVPCSFWLLPRVFPVGMKSKVDELKAAYDREECPCLEEYDPHTVASLLKQYMRELPDNLLGKELVLRFEEACGRPSEAEKLQEFQRLLAEVPAGSRLLLAWLITHMDHVITRETDTKMNIQNISIVLNPTVQVSLWSTGDARWVIKQL